MNPYRTAAYVLLGVIPAMALLPLPLLLVSSPTTSVGAISWLSIGGFVGLCASVPVVPTTKNLPTSLLISLLVSGGTLVAGTLLGGFLVHLVRDWPTLHPNSWMLLLFTSPCAVAVHYIFKFSVAVHARFRTA